MNFVVHLMRFLKLDGCQLDVTVCLISCSCQVLHVDPLKITCRPKHKIMCKARN